MPSKTDLLSFDISQLIRGVADYPKPGIIFRDITGLLVDPIGLAATVAQLAAVVPDDVDVIAAIEARGFIVGSALAIALEKGFIPIRKEGKLPPPTTRYQYELEYGTAAVEIREGTLQPGQKVFVVDDVLATGGTALAATHLIEKSDAIVSALAFIIELDGLPGRQRLANYPVTSLINLPA